MCLLHVACEPVTAVTTVVCQAPTWKKAHLKALPFYKQISSNDVKKNMPTLGGSPN